MEPDEKSQLMRIDVRGSRAADCFDCIVAFPSVVEQMRTRTDGTDLAKTMIRGTKVAFESLESSDRGDLIFVAAGAQDLLYRYIMQLTFVDRHARNYCRLSVRYFFEQLSKRRVRTFYILDNTLPKERFQATLELFELSGIVTATPRRDGLAWPGLNTKLSTGLDTVGHVAYIEPDAVVNHLGVARELACELSCVATFRNLASDDPQFEIIQVTPTDEISIAPVRRRIASEATQAAVCHGADEETKSEMTSTKPMGLDMRTMRMVIDKFDNSIDFGRQHYSIAGDFLPTKEKCLETFLLDGSILVGDIIIDARTRYGPEDGIFQINVGQEIDKFFDDSSIPTNGQPEFVLILGPVCAGKTTIRRQRYSKGYVLIDAAEIFLSLSRGNYFEFGEAFEEPMEFIGSAIAQRAIKERRNIVTEMTGGSNDIKTIIDAMKELNYKGQVPYVHCDLEEAIRRNRNRGNDNISAYYTGRYHERWILNAAGA